LVARLNQRWIDGAAMDPNAQNQPQLSVEEQQKLLRTLNSQNMPPEVTDLSANVCCLISPVTGML